MNNKNIFVIAKKEANDYLHDSGFLIILSICTVIIFASTYIPASMTTATTVLSSINVKMISQFIPLIGIALGFNTVVKERISGSLNVLLTHPVYRDNIITGKIVGTILVLAVIIVFSVLVSTGAVIIFYGRAVEYMELERIFILTIFTFLYACIYLFISVFISINVKTSSEALIYNIIIWLATCVLFGSLLKTTVFILTEQTSVDSVLIMQLLNLSPIHHYAQAIGGSADYGFGGVNAKAAIYGFFDTRYTLTQIFNEFWVNIVILIITPIILLVATFITFLRKDITL
ncbi:ABC-type transport system involved in multi-copper enzyme maturation, permease component [Methanolobus tindarius DSM 2278]|uniref:ABC-type transport system involved in multi-copper enzyme maturation, permease component n=1 Tax=Methanolobus tindarius DSM 2278 TaxID=1090322 RepID=W9DQW0_METTI|nr:ABC transporter permease [Methanolobus tindarius]ETA67963.1 ABC-type transport system involved in multi-copper enzyme maturation, permease component [Methanolobus tindarius DSM 2278]